MNYIRLLLLAALILLGIAIFLFAEHSADLAQTLLMRRDPATGVSVWGTRTDVLFKLLLGGAVLLVNAVLAYTFFSRRRIYAYLLATAAALYELLLCITIFGIIANN